MGRKPIILLMLVFMLLVPTQALAVDFDITEVKIDALLNEDGSANVTEQFTYAFDDDFEGITRSLIAKEGTRIENFSASENGSALKVEQEDGLYKIYRNGNSDETIQIELAYEIVGAVEKYIDGAQFYWPFFDDSNESEYSDLTISVIPPAPASEAEALGYDEAYETEQITEDGTVLFDLGTVPEGETADVRAVFEPELFPDVAAESATIRDELAEDRQQLADEAAAFVRNQQIAKSVGIPLTLVFGFVVFLMWLIGWMRSAQHKRSVNRSPYEFFVPKESMSIPALLFFANSSFLSPNTVSAALVDLMRKGHIRQLTEDRFELIDRKTAHAHEQILIELLFDQIGDGQEFTLEQVEQHTKNEANHESYNAAISEWTNSVHDEVKTNGFYEKHPLLRWTAGILSAALAALAIYLGIYEIFAGMAAAIVLAMLALGFAVGYSPITRSGHEIRYEWQHLKSAMANLPADQWERLSSDDKQRAYAFLLGSDPKAAERKAAVFSSAASEANGTGFMMNPVLMTAVFVSAGTTTSASASSGSVGSGTGVGGGGGGSGAF